MHTRQQDDQLVVSKRDVWERRGKPRIFTPFPSVVEGVDEQGEGFKYKTVLDNVSASGAYLRLTRPLEIGTEMLILITVSTSVVGLSPGLLVKISSRVLRVEPKIGGAYGLGVTFTRRRIL